MIVMASLWHVPSVLRGQDDGMLTRCLRDSQVLRITESNLYFFRQKARALVRRGTSRAVLKTFDTSEHQGPLHVHHAADTAS
ncbi:TPA: hypothetical protein ACH3X2_012739 [Trebouxia sp. C0005]